MGLRPTGGPCLQLQPGSFVLRRCVKLTEDVFWRVGPLAVYTLGFSLALGFLTATISVIPQLRRRGIRRQQALNLMLALMLFSVIGARLAVLLFRQGARQGGIMAMLSVPPDGLSYYGGLLAALAVVVWFCWRNEWPLFSVTDAMAPPIGLGVAVGLAVTLSTNLVHVQWGGPTWTNLILFTLVYGVAFLLWQRRERGRFPGELTLMLLGLDSILRILTGYIWTLSEGPFSSIRGPLVALAISTAFWFSLRGAAQRRSRGQEAATSCTEEPRKAHSPIWAVGYTMLAAMMLIRLNLG